MTASAFLTNSATRHQVFIQRYMSGVSNDAVKMLNRLRRDILTRLSQEPTQFRMDRLNTLLIEIDGLMIVGFGNINGLLTKNSKDFAVQEANFAARMMDNVTPDNMDFILPSQEQLLSALSTKPMSGNLVGSPLTIQGALDQFESSKSKEIKRIINDGVILGDTTPEISKKVNELIGVKHNNQLNSLTRTILSHSSSLARDETYSANSDILDGYEWISTLDSRTSHVCMARDGKIYAQGAGIYPPAHFQCRSTTIPNVKDEFTIVKLKGTRAASGDKAGQVAGDLNYGQWLKKQSRGFQEEALGIEKAKAFRTGKLKIEQFVDPTGETLSLAQLRARYPSVFSE